MAIFVKEFECPSCGGKIRRENSASRSVSCGYCGQTSHINAESLKAAGEQHPLIDYGSFLKIGGRGRVNDLGFVILGQVRMKYPDGFWDEWYINYDDGKEGWIEEDDGSFVLYEEEGELYDLDFNEVQVGTFSHFNQALTHVFITEKSKAIIEGGEGELPFRITPGEQADFLQGIKDGEVISVELLPDHKTVFRGRPVTLEELGITN